MDVGQEIAQDIVFGFLCLSCSAGLYDRLPGKRQTVVTSHAGGDNHFFVSLTFLTLVTYDSTVQEGFRIGLMV